MKNIGVLMCLLFLTMACEKQNKTLLIDIKASNIDLFPEEHYVLVEQDEGDKSVFVMTWTETLFYFGDDAKPTPVAPVQYAVEIDRVGNDFQNAQTIAVTADLKADILHKELNTVLTEKLGAEPDEPIEIEVRIIAYYGQNQVYEESSVNKLILTITPFFATQGIKEIYLVGDMNGWNNRNTDFILFRDDNDPKNQTYTYVGRIQENCYFKFLPAESLGSYKAYSRKDEQQMEYVDSEGGAFYNQTEGYKKITINIQNMTYVIEDYDVSDAKTYNKVNFVGAFCDWGNNDADPVMKVSAYDPHIWTLDITLDIIDYGVKFRTNHSWDKRWCPSDPNSVPYGKLDYNPTNHDNNISLSETGNYRVVFNDLTGHFIILKK